MEVTRFARADVAVLGGLVEIRKVGCLVVNIVHVDVVQLGSYGLSGLLPNHGARHLLGHKTVHLPVVVCQLASILEVLQNFLAQFAELTG